MKNKKKDTPIVFSLCDSGDVNALFDEISSKPDSVSLVDRAGRSLLINAVVNDKIELVKLFIKFKSDVNLQDKTGKSALHFMAIGYHVRIGELLLGAKANIEARDGYGNTPLSDAVFYSKGRGDIIKLLLKNGANPHLKNNHGVSPLDLASTIANYNIIQYFN